MENQPSIEQEIAQLEKQLSEKKASLGRELAPDDSTYEKETLHKIIGKKLKQQVPPAVGEARQERQYQPISPKPKQDDNALSYVLPELKDRVQELVNLVFNKSLDEGIKEVSRYNNPALIDAFHDVLVDELYNMLLERKKLEEVK